MAKKDELAELVTVAADTTRTNAPQVDVRLRRSVVPETNDLILWAVIRGSTNALSFNYYKQFTDAVMCGKSPTDAQDKIDDIISNRSMPFPDIESYRMLKVGTEVFMMVNCGVTPPFDRSKDAHGEKSGLKGLVFKSDP